MNDLDEIYSLLLILPEAIMTQREENENMFKLTYSTTDLKFHGFTVTPGLFYGYEIGENGQEVPVVTSGKECGDNIYIYFLSNGRWIADWIDMYRTRFLISGLPEIDLTKKMSFLEYSKIMADVSDSSDEVWEKYQSYLYDGLPKLARLILWYGIPCSGAMRI